MTDRATGEPLAFREVGAAVAAAGGVSDAKPTDRFIAVHLRRPVTPGGGARILIEKTYLDAASYHDAQAGEIVFERSLGIKRNAVVLPKGYELVSCNYPAQILQESDGRIKIAFWNATPAEAPLILKARLVPEVAYAPSSLAAKLDERAHQNREIVYYLQQPETHSFDLTHDYTESRPGVGSYVNVVRTGSKVARPSALILDTGAALTPETIRGAAVAAADPDAHDVDADTEAVVFRFPPVRRGQSVRLRIAETYTDPVRYGLTGNELVWHRSFGRPANAVVLPAGWMLTNSSVPAVIAELPDGRTRLDYINPRDDEIDVIITAQRRQS